MNKTTIKLTVFFEDPFWVGVFERIEGGQLSACKITFGAEPREQEVWQFILRHAHRLKFGPALAVLEKPMHRNPKRRQRAARSQPVGIGTKSQQALQLGREQSKAERHAQAKAHKVAQQAEKYAKKQQKRKDKHRGR